MIAQAEAHTGVKSRKFESPFRLHPDYGCVFAPWGMFGTLYAVETEAEYQRLNKKFPPIFWFNHFGTYNALFVLPLFLSRALHWNLLERCFFSVAIFFLLFFPYVARVKMETRDLQVAQPRLPFSVALRQYASKRDRGALWLLSILFGFCAWMIWMINRDVHGDQQFFMWPLVVLCALSSLANILMIFLRESASLRKA